MIQQPLLSVIIPTCHRNDLLEKCLMCLGRGRQKEMDLIAVEIHGMKKCVSGESPVEIFSYEVIVTDDGRDSTAEALVRSQFPWARWIAGPGRGPASNRNHGAKASCGKWLVFTDDDCLPDPEWLVSFALKLKELPMAQVLEGRTTCRNPAQGPGWTAPVNLDGGLLWSCNFLVCAKLFEAVGGFDENFPYPSMEDVDLRERLAKAGVGMTFVSGATVDHPSRKMPFGRLLARTHESYYYWKIAKCGNRGLGLHYFYDVTRRRLRDIVLSKWGWLSIRATLSLADEIFWLAIHCRHWTRKYSALQPDKAKENVKRV